MKKRHIIMIIILVLFAATLFSIKDAKNIKKLTCTTNSDFHGMNSDITLTIKVKNSEIQDMNIIIDAIIPEEYASQKQNIINSMGADGRMKVTSTDRGIKFEAGMASTYFDSLGLNTNSSYNELKQALELQNFTCE